MRTLALTLAYDGTDWAGMQRQPGLPTIQGTLEEALCTVLRHPIAIAAAGRTDAGVHALGQVISLRTDNTIPPDNLRCALNRQLPDSLRVRWTAERPVGFHARFSARSRRYWYVVQPTRWPDPLRGRFCWQVPHSLDVGAMAAALSSLHGRHDFTALCHGAVPPGGAERTLRVAQVHDRGHCIVIDVQADAFLRQMVRLLVANLVVIGRGQRPITWLEELLRSRTRHLAGQGAPPWGLCLMRIGYAPMVDPSPEGDVAGELAQ